jgi:single-stranded DNA-binding protein
MIKMARLNMVNLIGTVVNDQLDPRTIGSEKTDGENKMEVLNFLIRTFDEEYQRYFTLPVAVWGEDLVGDCLEFIKKGDLVYVQGELRYKFIYNKQKKMHEKIYTTVKAATVEFISKKLKDQPLNYSMNEVKLIGNLVEDPITENSIKEYPREVSVIEENRSYLEAAGLDVQMLIDKQVKTVNEEQAKILESIKGFSLSTPETGFVIAVDRLYPSKDLKIPNHKLTDYVTLVVNDKSKIKGDLKKGSVAIVDGKLMTRKRNEKIVEPRIVVDVKEMVGR